VFEHQAHQYFTPASNTKIFTLFAGFTLLGDSIPALKYIERADSLIFKGMGDPSFLHSKAFDSRRAFDFLQKSEKQLFLANENFPTTTQGPGWAWDDYNYTYSSERSAFPIFGNYISINLRAQTFTVKPQLFSFHLSVGDTVEKSKVVRDMNTNRFVVYPDKKQVKNQSWSIPFKTSVSLTAELLSDTLKKKVSVINFNFSGAGKTLYSVPADSLYKVMMQASDNFIAEQLLLVCAGVLSDTLKPEIAIEYMKKHHLNDLPDTAVWVDGSGLSRYNLFTPASIVRLWEKVYEKVPPERLFPLLAIGGKTGTLKNSFKNDPPYVYGKTGTLSNNHSLSGYLISKKGKTYVFSFMNNNHPVASSAVRKEMESILKLIYENN
jgi:D-alanyl-D-alanine carboxypeptidase/D-alanyl-D-alanine-endopeptidase (penicillin-binding protein 4)